jgi:hypothetical protein
MYLFPDWCSSLEKLCGNNYLMYEYQFIYQFIDAYLLVFNEIYFLSCTKKNSDKQTLKLPLFSHNISIKIVLKE